MTMHPKHLPRTDAAHFQFGRAPSSPQLLRMFSFPKAVTMCIPPVQGGVLVLVIGYDPVFSVHPVALYGIDGSPMPLPGNHLSASCRPDLPFEAKSFAPFRSFGEVREFALGWTRKCIDKPAKRVIQ
jgi:hypothetical protein